jgi:tetratricopeptide (TPR) repeat protein
MAEQRGPARGSNSGNRNPGQSRGKGASQEGPPRGKGASSRSGRPPRDGDGRDGGRESRPSRDGASRGRPSRDGASRGRDGGRDDRPSRDGASRGRDGGRDDRPSRDGGSRGRDGGRDDRPSRDGGSRGRDGGRDSRPSRDGGSRGRDDERRSGARGLRGDGREAPPEAGPRSWGGLARRGAARINEDQSLHEPELEAEDQPPSEKDDPEGFAKHEARVAKRALGDANRERLRNEAQAAIARSEAKPAKRKPRAKKVPEALERRPLAPHKLPDPKRQLKDLLGDSAGGRAWRDLNQAAEDIEEGRSGQARVLAERLYRRTPEVIEVAEMYGLALYGQGKWRETVEVLEQVRESSGLPDQNPVLADAHRALGNYADVEALWAELREASPANDLINEGRIVAAGALGDQGRLQDAVRLLSKGWKRPKRPLEHHLRRAYALADLYERAGERPQAKELFGWIAHHEPLYLDAKKRSQ